MSRVWTPELEAELRTDSESLFEDYDSRALRDCLAAALDEIELRGRAVDLYGTHLDDCAMRQDLEHDCSCGLIDALGGPPAGDAMRARGRQSPAGWQERVRVSVGQVGQEGPLEVGVGPGLARVLAGSRSCAVVYSDDSDDERVTITDAGRAALRDDEEGLE